MTPFYYFKLYHPSGLYISLSFIDILMHFHSYDSFYDYYKNIFLGKGAKIATVIAKMDNFGTRNFEGAKPYTINQNGANLVILKIGVKFDR